MIKEIYDFDGYYISDDGKVFCNLGKGNRDRNKRTEMYEINPRATKNGYMRVCMRQNSTGKRVDRYIHRLVAEYFIPNPFNKKYVNHINCLRYDNRAENLEWVTAKENNNQTANLAHLIRDELGRFVSNFQYNKAIL